MNFFETGDRVRWTKANPDGWSGNGHATVKTFDNKRRFFGPGNLTANDGNPGPAFEIELDGDRSQRVWVGPNELEPLPS